VLRAATWRPTERLFTFRRSAAPGGLIETPQTPKVGHATFYKIRFLYRVAYACGTTEIVPIQRVRSKWRLMTRLLGLGQQPDPAQPGDAQNTLHYANLHQ
jgi:hypothetical protein